ncbi:MAG: hypothetical protein ACRDA4_10660 [Filifactoraceae bacterium]
MSSVYQDFIDGYVDQITERQLKAISFIENMTDIEFTGEGKDDARTYISKNIEKASEIRAEQLKRFYYYHDNNDSSYSYSYYANDDCSGNCRSCSWSGCCDGEDEIIYENNGFSLT